jgi:hypothetical protein
VVSAFLRDPVVSNTNPNLTNTDTAGDNEPSIAVNPQNQNEIVLASFSGGTGLWHTLDGGNTWTFQNSYPQPPGEGVPCDQQPDYARGNLLAVTFLTCTNSNITTGTTTNPALQTSWNWPLDAAGNLILTNTQGVGNADQPWLVTAPQPGNMTQDNIYVAYDDFNGGPDMQVARSAATNPPNFTSDVQVGTTTLCCGSNPGLRLAADRRTGFVYAIWQDASTQNADNSVNANIHLNRTTDGGATWGLNGNANGIVVASGASNQRNPKFGTVNALIGGVHHAAVDPVTGDVYVVYACGDGTGGDNPLCIRRGQRNATGGLTMGTPSVITTRHSALPSVAVASNGVIGVLSTAFDGFSSDGFPIFSAHLSLSDDHGATWGDRVLETSLSPVTDNGNNRQRVLGDYQELAAVGRTFYGTFTGNGVPFGRPFSNMDPIFFKASAGGPIIAVSGDLNFGTVARGTTATRAVTVQNVGTDPLVVNGVSFTAGSDPAFSVAPNPATPVTIQPSDSVVFTVRFSPPASSGPGTSTGTLQIQSNDPDTPTATLAATGIVGVPQAVLAANNLQLGGVPVDDRTAPHESTAILRLTNEASCPLCDLTVTSLPISGPHAADYSLVGAPSLPVKVAAGDHLDLTVQFNPSAAGTRTATVSVNTDDPVTPSQAVSLSGSGLLSEIGVQPDPVVFGPTVFDPSCGTPCGQTRDATVSNTGQAELIVDKIAFSNPIFAGPGAASPPRRVAPNGSFTEPITFHPTGGPARAIRGTLSIQQDVAGSTIAVQRNVALCGESVGRGIRVLVVNSSGAIYPTVDRIRLESVGLKPKISANMRNAALTTIDPPTSCQRIQFHYENQNLKVAQTTGQPASHYLLRVTQGKRTTRLTFDLAVNEFKVLVVTV